jgi:isochorismate synthase
MRSIECASPFAVFDGPIADFHPVFLWKERDCEELWMALGAASVYPNLAELQGEMGKVRERNGVQRTVYGYGAVAFDPEQSLTHPWEGFISRMFILPELLCHWKEGTAELTAVVPISEERMDAAAKLFEDATYGLPPQIVGGGRAFSRDAWTGAVKAIQVAMEEKHFKKAVLARDSIRKSGNIIRAGVILDRLAQGAQGNYLFAYRTRGATFLGASPERLFSWKDGTLETESLAGTRPRGHAEDEERRFADELRNSSKERREQNLVTKMLEEQLADFCESVERDSEPEIRRSANVQHLYTHLRGRLQSSATLDGVLNVLHPTPAVCGVPRDRARDLLSGLEPFQRGWYAGAIGKIGEDEAEFAVAIRCALLRDHHAYIYAGAGIMPASDAAHEWQETAMKMRPMLKALGC